MYKSLSIIFQNVTQDDVIMMNNFNIRNDINSRMNYSRDYFSLIDMPKNMEMYKLQNCITRDVRKLKLPLLHFALYILRNQGRAKLLHSAPLILQ